MATSKELYVWAHTLKGWADLVEAGDVHQHMVQLAAELDRLAASKEAAERQLV